MMKRLLMTFTIALVLGMTTGTLSATEYCKDYLEAGNPGGWGGSSLKTFEEEATPGGDTIFIDIWINDLRPDVQGMSDALISGGFKITYSPSISLKSITPYTSANGGPWDPQSTSVNEFPSENRATMTAAQLGNAFPDSGGDIILAKLEFQGTGTITVTPVPDFDTNVSGLDGHNYDPDISPNTFTIKGEVAECEKDADCDDGLYCNGDERCVGGSCQSGTNPCPGFVCDEGARECGSTPATTTSTIPSGSTTTSTATVSSTTTTTTTTTTTSGRWSKAYGKMWEDKKDEKLSLLRTFRDEVLADSEIGRKLTSLLYNNSSEVLTLLLRNPPLIEESKNVIDGLLPRIQSMLNGEGRTLSGKQLVSVTSLLTKFEIKATPGLKASIKTIKNDCREKTVFEQLHITIVD